MDGLGLALLGARAAAENTTSSDNGTDLVPGGALPQEFVDATFEFIDQLQWSAAQSIRTSIITLASFNVVVAFATLACIIWDCWSVTKKTNSAPWTRTLRPSFLSPAHTYPFILSLGIVVQGIIFAVIQSRGLKGLLLLGCVPLSQAMMPATFIVPYIQVVFGMESASRAVRRNPFPHSPKWMTPSCLGLIVLGLIGTYLATVLNRPPDACFADLFWFTQQWRVVSFALFISITGTLLLCIVAIVFGLRKDLVPSNNPERLAASNMIYYIAMAMISNALMIPFFVKITFGDLESSAIQALEVAMIASVVANLSGIMTGGLYLFLRSGARAVAESEAAKSLGIKDFERGEPDWKSHGAEKADIGRQSPVPEPYSPSVYPATLRAPPEGRRTTSSSAFNGLLQSLRDTNGFFVPHQSPTPPMPTLEIPTQPFRELPQDTPQSASFARGTVPNSPVEYLLPAATYTPGGQNIANPLERAEILMPPPLHLPGWHNRESSLSSSGTVQIGLRLSNMNDVQSRLSNMNDMQPRSSNMTDVQPMNPPRMELRPAGAAPMSPSPISSIHSSRSVSPASTVGPSSVPETTAETSTVDVRNKELPTLPLEEQPRGAPAQRLESRFYNPNIQTPRIRLASPQGVGFHQEAKGNSPSRLRGQMFSETTSSPVGNAEWI